MNKKLTRLSLICSAIAATMLTIAPADSQAARFRGAAVPDIAAGSAYGTGASRMDANADGINDFTGLPLGTGSVIGFADANGDGHNDYMDVNADGINDYTGLPLGTGGGAGFVDADGDGINDLTGFRRGAGYAGRTTDTNGDGINDFTGLPLGTRSAIGFVDANGDGHNDYMDVNADGINDYTGLPLGTGGGTGFVDADGDGINDLPGRSARTPVGGIATGAANTNPDFNGRSRR